MAQFLICKAEIIVAIHWHGGSEDAAHKNSKSRLVIIVVILLNWFQFLGDSFPYLVGLSNSLFNAVV